MSLRTVLTTAMFLGLLTVYPVSAQVDSAPMPRGKPRVIVCAEGFFQVEVPSGNNGSCESTPACPALIHFRPVPMPRAIVEVIGNIEFGMLENEGLARPVTIFRPAPLVRPARLTPKMVIQPTFAWNRPLPQSPPMPRAIVEVCDEYLPCQRCDPPVRVHQMRSGATQDTVDVDGTGGWWLEEVRLPQPKHGESSRSVPHDSCGGPSGCCQAKPYEDTVRAVMTKDVVPATTTTPALSSISGTWYRELEGIVIAATFAGEELKLCMTHNTEGMIAHVTLTAHYAVTPEGVVHGVVNGADVDVKATIPEARSRTATAVAEGMADMQKLVDCPFSFRVKSTSIGVMVSNLRVAADGMGSKEMAILCGMFRHAVDDKVPTPRVTKTHTPGSMRCSGTECCGPAPVPVNVGPQTYGLPMPTPTSVIPAGHTDPDSPMPAVPVMVPPALPGGTSSNVSNPRLAEALGTMTQPSGRYLHHYPEYYPPDPRHPLPRELAAQEDPEGARKRAAQKAGTQIKPLPTSGVTGGVHVVMPSPTYSPTRPTNIPPGDFGMMSEVFGQMLGAKPQLQPLPVSAAVSAGTQDPIPTMPIPRRPGIERPR